MKTLTKLCFLAAGLAAVSLPAFAADNATSNANPAANAPATPARHPHLRALAARGKLRARIAKRLDLTDAQKQQLKAKRAETKNALQAIRSDASLTKEQKHAKARELLQSARTNFRSVLTPGQQAKLDHMRARVRAHHKAKPTQ